MTPKALAKFIKERYAEKRGYLRFWTGNAPEIKKADEYLNNCASAGIQDIFNNSKAFLGLMAILYTSFGRHLGGAYAEEYGGIGYTGRLIFSDRLLNGASVEKNGEKLFFLAGDYTEELSQKNANLTLREAIVNYNNYATGNLLIAILEQASSFSAFLDMRLNDINRIMVEFLPYRFLPRMERVGYLQSTPFTQDAFDWVNNSEYKTKRILLMSYLKPTRCATKNDLPLIQQHTLGNIEPAFNKENKFSAMFALEHQDKFETFFERATYDQIEALSKYLNDKGDLSSMDFEAVLNEHTRTISNEL